MSDNNLPPKRTPYVPRRDLSSLAGRLGAAWDLLAGRPFSPGLPVEPDPVTNGEIPRQFQFTVGQNTSRFPRGESVRGVSLTPFDQLRQFGKHRGRVALGSGWLADGQTDFTLRMGDAGQAVDQHQHVFALVAKVFGHDMRQVRPFEAQHR